MKKLIIIASIAISTSSFAQIKTNLEISQNSIPNQTPFLDASSSINWNSSTNIGKGLVFPRTDLVQLSNLIAIPNGVAVAYPNRLDGMVVYNTASGKAGIGNTDVSQGFYYYENKSNLLNGGTWKRIGNENLASITTLYTGDGTLKENRTVTMDGKNLAFNGTGNIGIGTTNPTEKLEVNGNVKINNLYETEATAPTKTVAVGADGVLKVKPKTPGNTIDDFLLANQLYTTNVSSKEFYPVIIYFKHYGGIMGYKFSIVDDIWHIEIVPTESLNFGEQGAAIEIMWLNR